MASAFRPRLVNDAATGVRNRHAGPEPVEPCVAPHLCAVLERTGVPPEPDDQDGYWTASGAGQSAGGAPFHVPRPRHATQNRRHHCPLARSADSRRAPQAAQARASTSHARWRPQRSSAVGCAGPRTTRERARRVTPGADAIGRSRRASGAPAVPGTCCATTLRTHRHGWSVRFRRQLGQRRSRRRPARRGEMKPDRSDQPVPSITRASRASFLGGGGAYGSKVAMRLTAQRGPRATDLRRPVATLLMPGGPSPDAAGGVGAGAA